MQEANGVWCGMSDLRLYNNLARAKQVFTPQDASRVTIYVCGPTVYGASHIGNARPAVVFDVLVRLLRLRYRGDGAVIYARNITDIDDKINAKAATQGVGIEVIAARYRAQYHQDMKSLGVLPPDIEPHATAHIEEIQAMIAVLLQRNHAYEAERHVLFDVSSDADYGSLARRNMEEMQAGARVEVAPYKRNDADFVLWKPSTPDQPGWDSVWGRGRPGWHIECSAMIEKHLGETIDIHGGGVDLQFPHHENESAQSRCAHTTPLARYWLHNGMLTNSGEKMSKSVGNISLIKDLLADYSGVVLRLALLQTHYRQTLDFNTTLLEQCTSIIDRITRAVEGVEASATPPANFIDALCDDINTPQAMAVLFEYLRNGQKAEAKAAAAFLGILPTTPQDIDDATRLEIEAMVATRDAARADKDFALADKMRDDLAALNVVIEDSPTGTKWRYK